MTGISPFSSQTRRRNLGRIANESFDLLVVGGGITGAAVARDASSRGLRVALVEKHDFAYGTSSRSSKLIHGGLRYLEQKEFKLVFEALHERTLLLKTAPHMVKPLPFYFPVFEGAKRGMNLISLGLWIYDLLSLFRTPGFHRRLSAEKFASAVPGIRKEGLQGGFLYYDASMWDDVLVTETLRSAHDLGAVVLNYCEAVEPIRKMGEIRGFRVIDRQSSDATLISISAKRTILCGGPWTDQLGQMITQDWKPWLTPSRGVHLVFDLKRLPVPGTVVMSTDQDGRIAFVIPRPDFGPGVTIVGTTDGPAPKNPEDIDVVQEDVDYLISLLSNYFPSLRLTRDDILSAYVGIRPLVGPEVMSQSLVSHSGGGTSASLQKVSREHHISFGPGGVVVVAGGKYTTHRTMAKEIVDFAMKHDDLRLSASRDSSTEQPINFSALSQSIENAKREAIRDRIEVPAVLWDRYGADALTIARIDSATESTKRMVAQDPEGFPMVEAQLRFAIRYAMVMRLEDFYFRRTPLFMSLKDHGRAWIAPLSTVWAQELGLSIGRAHEEAQAVSAEIDRRMEWMRQ